MLTLIEHYKIVAPSDFYIDVEQITDNAGNVLDPTITPFHFEFVGKDGYVAIKENQELKPSQSYIVSFDGTNRINNIVTPEGKLRFVFQNYSFANTTLYYRQIDVLENPDFDDNKEDVYTIEEIDITISRVGVNTSSTVVEAQVVVAGAIQTPSSDNEGLTELQQTVAALSETVVSLSDRVTELETIVSQLNTPNPEAEPELT